MRFFQIKRMLALLMTCAAAAAVFPATVFAARAERDLPIYCVGRDDNVVSLSFDAAV